jgi:predicted N-formylglutamate amidohydrolase
MTVIHTPSLKTEARTQNALLTPDDPPPCSVYNESGLAPLLLVADHASRAIPRNMHQLGLHAADLDKHIAWDPGSADVARCLADLLDAPLILSGYSRLLIDPNRQVGDVTAIPAISDGIVIPGNQIVDEQHRQWRIDTFFRPYHAAIAERLDRFAAAGISPAFVSLHTCTPVLGGMNRPWHIGVMWDKDSRIAARLIAGLRRIEGLCVGDNEPYSGRHPHDFTIDFHAEGRGLAHVGIEVRQDLLTNPAEASHWAGILAKGLAEPLADAAIYRTMALP